MTDTDTTELVARLRSYGPGSPEMNLMPLFRVAWEAAEAIERLTRERDEARALLCKWDALIKHQYTGSREAMTDMTLIAQETARKMNL